MKGKYIVTTTDGKNIKNTEFDASCHKYEWLACMGTQILRVSEYHKIDYSNPSNMPDSFQFWEFSQPCIIMFEPEK